MKKLTNTLFALSLAGLSCVASAQSNEATSKEHSEKKDNIETIEVVGRKTLGRLQIEVTENAFEVANIFNQYITDEDLRLICEKKKLSLIHI